MNTSIHFRFSLKSTVQICLAVVLIFLTTGCSGIPLFTPQEPVTLRFTYIENTADYAVLAEEFTRQNPNITIELDPATLSRDTMRTLALKAEEADVIRIPLTAIDDKFASAFLPLDTILTTDQQFNADDLFPNSLDGLRLAGKQVGVPAGINPFVVFSNPAKFTAAGFEPPTPGWVLEDFITSAMSVNNTDESLRGSPQLTYGFCTHPALPDSLIISFLFGGGVFDNIYNPSSATLNSPENVSALTWYASLKNDFGLVPEITRTFDVGAMVARGNCAFWMDWLDRSIYGRYGDYDVDMLPLPAYNTPFTVALLDSYSILATSEHSEEAWQWIRFLLSQPTASGYLVPPNVALLSDPEFTARVEPDALVVARNMPQQTVILGVDMYGDQRLGQIVQLYSEATEKVLKGELDAQTALDLAQQQADQVFQR
jgi:ABC-type glycerol-3-phosphate transport system substrate-binding protein